MDKAGYQIIISFDSHGERLVWDVKKCNMPHYVGNNIEELKFVKDCCEEVVKHVNRMLNEKNKHQ